NTTRDDIDALADLPAGEYSVYLFENDGYTVLAQKDITVKAQDTEVPATAETPATTDPAVTTDDSGSSDAPPTGDWTPFFIGTALTAVLISLATLLFRRKRSSR
ncbi:MAG: hypothetical protein ACI3XR_05030, partial [Eubacteriales bacterium]